MIGPVCVITDADAPLSAAEQARAAARGGASAVQLRDKHAPDEDLAALVRMLMPELSALGVLLMEGQGQLLLAVTSTFRS